MIMESLYQWLTANSQQSKTNVCMHANEWQTAFSIFYLRDHCPTIATLFTTHATGIGRSIAGNGKPLYDCFEGFHGDQMAQELNMVSKINKLVLLVNYILSSLRNMMLRVLSH